MNTRPKPRQATMPPAIYEKYEKTRAEFENTVKTPVTRQQLSYACWVYGNKLKNLTKEN